MDTGAAAAQNAAANNFAFGGGVIEKDLVGAQMMAWGFLVPSLSLGVACLC